MHTAFKAQGAGDGRDHRLVTVGTDAHLDAPREIDALDEFEKAVDEVLPRLLAVGYDVDAAVLLQLEGDEGCVPLALFQSAAGEPPRRPQPHRLGKPCRFRQAAGNGGRKQLHDENIISGWQVGSSLFARPIWTPASRCWV